MSTRSVLRHVCTQVAIIAFAMVSTAQAQQIYWKRQNVELKVNNLNGGNSVSSFNGIFQKVLVTPVAYECGYKLDPQVEVRQGTCYDVTCAGGAGSSPNWDAFYSAKKAEKATKLANAIKGVGKTSAEALVANGFFSSKPRSWDSFKAEIKSAGARGVISEQVTSMVLNTYRVDNMANLGYSANSCQKTAYACNEVVVIREGGYVPQTCYDNVEQVVEQKAMNYTFNVQNSILLPSETESITVSVSPEPLDSAITASYYNTYIQQVLPGQGFNSVVMNIQGTGRKQVSLPASGLQSVSLLPTDSTKATLQIGVSPAILPANPSESLLVQFQVRTCQVGFLGTCGFGWDHVQNFNGTITNTISSFYAPVSITPGRNGVKMEVEVKVFKQNSVYHNASPISRTTSKITIK